MASRRALFGLSVGMAVAFYLAIFALAPNIEMMHAGIRPERIMARLNIYLRDPASILQPDTQADNRAFTARPGSVRDLLKMNEAPVLPPAVGLSDAPIPDLASRIASDALLQPPAPIEDSLRRIDAQVLEITRDAARRDLEVPRRLVRPSPEENPAVEGFPLLRAEGNAEGTATLALPPSGLPGLLAQDPRDLAASGEAAPVAPDGTQPLVQLDMPESMPVFEAEKESLRTPIRQAMASAQEERPYAFMDGLLDIELKTWRNPGEAEGYFELRILPRKGESIPVLPKDVAFVVDASSSIPQHKLNITVKGVRAALKQLKPDDRFTVVAFRDTPQPFKPELVSATRENLDAAEQFVANLVSSGQTDVYKALQPMVQQTPRVGVPGVVVVVSDGRPTAGLQDSRAIINGLTADNTGANGIYAFGGGKTVNRYLLDLLAYRNKGAAEVSSSIEGIEKGLPQFFSALRDPILVNLNADFGRIDATSIYPQTLPDFFQGQAVTLYGRYNPGQDDTFFLRIAGRAGNERKEVIFRTGFDDAEEGTRDITRGWAFQRAYHLIGRISREGETPELLNALKQLRVEYGVRTSYDQ